MGIFGVTLLLTLTWSEKKNWYCIKKAILWLLYFLFKNIVHPNCGYQQNNIWLLLLRNKNVCVVKHKWMVTGIYKSKKTELKLSTHHYTSRIGLKEIDILEKKAIVYRSRCTWVILFSMQNQN